MNLLRWMLAFALFTAAALAADVTGRWTGTIEFNRDGESRSSSALLILKQDGTKISGTIGPDDNQQHSIKTGSIENDKLTIEVEPESGPAKVLLTLTVNGNDQITGTFKGETPDGPIAGKIDVKREK